MAAMTVSSTIWWASVAGASPARMFGLTFVMVAATSLAVAGTFRSVQAPALVSVEVCFETHSTSVDNELGIATGWNEGELSETGRRQAVRLGDVAATIASRRLHVGSSPRGSDGRAGVRRVAASDRPGSPIAGVQLRRAERHAARQLEAERRLRIDEPVPGRRELAAGRRPGGRLSARVAAFT